MFLYQIRIFKYNSAVLADAIAMPGMYTLRFILTDRRHDATEFQEAQSALGLSYSGHSLDWIFYHYFYWELFYGYIDPNHIIKL